MKFILIFFIVIYLLGQTIRFFFKRWVSKMAQKSNPQAQQQQTKKEGEVTVNNSPSDKKMYDQTVGDYVDYEETE